MPVIWNLREWLKERGVTRASQVRRIVRERTGYPLSTQAVCDLFNDQPKMLRVETSQAVCDGFYCCLSEFFEVKPRAARRSRGKGRYPPDPLSSPDDPGIKQGKGARSDAQQRPLTDKTKVDFAGFFPHARKFSSEPPKE